jgi:hypothetical protein
MAGSRAWIPCSQSSPLSSAFQRSEEDKIVKTQKPVFGASLVVVIASLLLLSGCATPGVTFVEIETGEVLNGKFISRTDVDGADGTAEVTMPDGELLSGPFSFVPGNDEIRFSAATAAATANVPDSGIGAQRTNRSRTGGQAKAYALLASTTQGSNLVMEIVVIHSVAGDHGLGEARTNDGRVYKVKY